MEKERKPYPKWVKKFRKKGTAVTKSGNNYYLVKVHSEYDKTTKKVRRITDAYLGKITAEGFVPAKKRVQPIVKHQAVTVKEFGASAMIAHVGRDIIAHLKETYPDDWKSIYTFAALRFMHNTPMKNLANHFDHSSLGQLVGDANLEARQASALLSKVGSDRERMVRFMKSMYAPSKENLVIDLTTILSSSQDINWLALSRTSEHSYHPLVNLLLVFSNDRMRPTYFRLLPGVIKDVSSVRETINESGIKNAVFIGDKAFHSEGNVVKLEEEQLQYILPVKRDSAIVSYDVLKVGDRKQFDGYFIHEKRHVWYKEVTSNELKAKHRRAILFFDERLRTEEEMGALDRADKVPVAKAEEKELLLSKFYEGQFAMGTITVLTNTSESAQKVYAYLKARVNIELSFDAFKNVLEADKTYARSDEQLYGWMFINYLSLLLYYELYGLLVTGDLLSHFSPKDLVLHFSRVYRVNLDSEVLVSEVPKRVVVLGKKLGFPEDLLHIQRS